MTREELKEAIIDYVIDTYSLNKDRSVVADHIEEWFDCRQQVKSVDLADVGETLSRSEFQEVVKRDAIGFQENGQFEEVDFEQLELIASSIWDDYKIVER